MSRSITLQHGVLSNMPGYTFFYGLVFFLFAGAAQGAVLVAVDDDLGLPYGAPLQVEAFGVLENDMLDGGSAGENGASAELVSGVTYGTLSCPSDPTLELCEDGSFDYLPDPGLGFTGTDSFTYQAVFGADVSAPATVTLTACSGGPDVLSCWQEAAYLAKLTELGYGSFREGFEGTAWDSVRTTLDVENSAPSVTNMGVTWTSNHEGTNEITTGAGAARTGEWGAYDPDHGYATGTVAECDIDNPPEHCLYYDGLSGRTESGGSGLLAVGGYITGFYGSNIAILLNGVPYDAGKLPDSGYQFFGVIDVTGGGFTSFEFRELDGKVGQQNLVWMDDFIIAISGTLPENNPPVLDLIGNQTVDEGVLLSILLTASDPDDGDSLFFAMTNAPLGSSLVDNLDGTATFSWTPGFDQAGDHTMTFTVTDNGVPSASDSETITISVVDVNQPPVLAPVGNQSVNENELLSILLTASDPDGDNLSFSVSGAPTGSSLVDNGEGTATFSWTPGFDQAGDYPVNFTVTDSGLPSASDSESISISVVDVNRPPVLSPIGNQSVNEGELLSILLTASDPDGDNLSFTMSGAPGANLVDNLDGTADFFWTPEAGWAGIYPVSFTVTDDGVPAAADSEEVSIVVSIANQDCTDVYSIIDVDTSCIGSTSITVHPGVVVRGGVTLALSAPVVLFMDSIIVEAGAILQVVTAP